MRFRKAGCWQLARLHSKEGSYSLLCLFPKTRSGVGFLCHISLGGSDHESMLWMDVWRETKGSGGERYWESKRATDGGLRAALESHIGQACWGRRAAAEPSWAVALGGLRALEGDQGQKAMVAGGKYGPFVLYRTQCAYRH